MITIACITDAKFMRHTGAMLHSALAASAPATCAMRVLHSDAIDADDQSRLHELVARFGATLNFIFIGDDRIADLPSGYFPRAVWLRILLPELLPDCAKILYLDSDIIVTSSLAPLWETDVSGHLLGAVTNPFYPFMPDHPRLQLGISDPRDYFNSGVLLMNLQRMRDQGSAAQLRAYAREHPGAPYPDQDALNAVCRGRWLALHPRWNVQSTIFELDDAQLPLPAAQIAEARAHPAVIHFIGLFKPWHYLCRHPLRDLYFEHARATPWGAPRIEGRSLRNVLLRPLPLAWIDRWMGVERRLARLWQRLRRRAAITAGQLK